MPQADKAALNPVPVLLVVLQPVAVAPVVRLRLAAHCTQLDQMPAAEDLPLQAVLARMFS
jgi:hypothetical protein